VKSKPIVVGCAAESQARAGGNPSRFCLNSSCTKTNVGATRLVQTETAARRENAQGAVESTSRSNTIAWLAAYGAPCIWPMCAESRCVGPGGVRLVRGRRLSVIATTNAQHDSRWTGLAGDGGKRSVELRDPGSVPLGTPFAMMSHRPSRPAARRHRPGGCGQGRRAEPSCLPLNTPLHASQARTSIGESRDLIQRLLNRKRLCTVATQRHEVDFV
jgi:hypothetical protein